MLAGVFDEVLKACKRTATYPREGGLYVAGAIVKNPSIASPAPLAGQRQGRYATEVTVSRTRPQLAQSTTASVGLLWAMRVFW